MGRERTFIVDFKALQDDDEDRGASRSRCLVPLAANFESSSSSFSSSVGGSRVLNRSRLLRLRAKRGGTLRSHLFASGSDWLEVGDRAGAQFKKCPKLTH